MALDAGHVVVVPRPGRTAGPLQVPRRADLRVVGHGIVARIVQVVRPLVDLPRTRLHDLLSTRRRLHVGHAVGRQHAHHFVPATSPGVLDHEQVHEVVDVRQSPARAQCRPRPCRTGPATGRAAGPLRRCAASASSPWTRVVGRWPRKAAVSRPSPQPRWTIRPPRTPVLSKIFRARSFSAAALPPAPRSSRPGKPPGRILITGSASIARIYGSR